MTEKNPLFGLAEGAGPNDQSPDYSNSIEQFLNGLLGPGWQQNPTLSTLTDYVTNQVIPTFQGEWNAGEQLRNIGTAVSDMPIGGNLLGPILYGIGGMQQAGAPAEPAVQQGTNILNTVASQALAPPGRPPLLPGMQPVDFTSNLQNLTNLAPGTDKPTSGNPAIDAMLYMGSAVNVPDLTDLAVKTPIAAAKLAPALGKLAPSLAAMPLLTRSSLADAIDRIFSPNPNDITLKVRELEDYLTENFSKKGIDVMADYGVSQPDTAIALQESTLSDIHEYLEHTIKAFEEHGLSTRSGSEGNLLDYAETNLAGERDPLNMDYPKAAVLFRVEGGGLAQTPKLRSVHSELEVGRWLPNGQWEHVGALSRDIKVKDGWVYNSVFAMNDTATGGGVGKDVFRAAFDYFVRKNYTHFSVTAGLETGPYAWARFGYLPSSIPKNGLRSRLNKLINHSNLRNSKWRDSSGVEHSNKGVDLTDDDIRLVEKVIASEDPRALWTLADHPRGLGWDMLTSRVPYDSNPGWSGRMSFNNSEIMDRFLSYIGDSIFFGDVDRRALGSAQHLTDAERLYSYPNARLGAIAPLIVQDVEKKVPSLADLAKLPDFPFKWDNHWWQQVRRGKKVRVYKWLHPDEIVEHGPAVLPGDMVFLTPTDAQQSVEWHRTMNLFSTSPYQTDLRWRSFLVDPEELHQFTGVPDLVPGVGTDLPTEFVAWNWMPKKESGWKTVSQQLGPARFSRTSRRAMMSARAPDARVMSYDPNSRVATPGTGPNQMELHVSDDQILYGPGGRPFNPSELPPIGGFSEAHLRAQGYSAIAVQPQGDYVAPGTPPLLRILDEDVVGEGVYGMQGGYYSNPASQAGPAPIPAYNMNPPATPQPSTGGGMGAPAAQGTPLSATIGAGQPLTGGGGPSVGIHMARRAVPGQSLHRFTTTGVLANDASSYGVPLPEVIPGVTRPYGHAAIPGDPAEDWFAEHVAFFRRVPPNHELYRNVVPTAIPQTPPGGITPQLGHSLPPNNPAGQAISRMSINELEIDYRDMPLTNPNHFLGPNGLRLEPDRIQVHTSFVAQPTDARPMQTGMFGGPQRAAPPANSVRAQDMWDDPDFVEVLPLETWVNYGDTSLGAIDGDDILGGLFPHHRFEFASGSFPFSNAQLNGYLIHRSPFPLRSSDGTTTTILQYRAAVLEDGSIVPFLVYADSEASATSFSDPEWVDRIVGMIVPRDAGGIVQDMAHDHLVFLNRLQKVMDWHARNTALHPGPPRRFETLPQATLERLGIYKFLDSPRRVNPEDIRSNVLSYWYPPPF